MWKKLKFKGKKFRYYLEYIFMLFVFKIFHKAGIQTASNFCGKIGGSITKFICKINGRHDKALENISLIFPNKTPLERKKILDTFYNYVGKFVGEYITQDKMDSKYFDENVEVVNEEIFDKYMENGFFGMTAHFGNWEIIHKFVSCKKGIKLNIIYRKQNNKFIEEKFIDNRPVNLIPKGTDSMRQLMGLIKQKKIVGILMDQRDNKGERYQFFGRGATTSTAIPRLSLKYDFPLMPVKCIRKRENPNKFKLVFEEPLILENKTGNLEEDSKKLTNKTLLKLEEWISEDPEQWFWMYDRWK
jgi:KDO2-lipid IV(A) lauroyltransferase